MGFSLGKICQLRVIPRTVVLYKDYAFLLWNSGDDSGPDLSFNKSASPECLFSLARVSLAEASKLDLSFGWFKGDYTSSEGLELEVKPIKARTLKPLGNN
ncbi:hypothetical protein Tco_0903252 [Tanacetum coccineum]